MEAEWENVKDQEMETVEEEKANFCSKDPPITPSTRVTNMVIKPTLHDQRNIFNE